MQRHDYRLFARTNPAGSREWEKGVRAARVAADGYWSCAQPSHVFFSIETPKTRNAHECTVARASRVRVIRRMSHRKNRKLD